MAKLKSSRRQQTSSAILKLKSEIFYNFSLGEDYLSTLAGASSTAKTLLVVPKARQALDLYKKGLAEGVVFLPEQMFDKKKFGKLLKKKSLLPEEVRFVLKVLV